MSKLTRQAAIRELLAQGPVENQDELRRRLYKRGHRVTQATLSRDIHELGLVKTTEGYAVPGEGEQGPDPWLPSVEKLIREFAYAVTAAQNLVVVRTSAGSAPAVAAAMDAEEWPELLGTIGGDDTILLVTAGTKQAEQLVERIQELLA
jgi:transcriptional regulator of arginine metabolism